MDEQIKFVVLDRRRSDFEQCAWSLRQMLSEEVNRGFGKWVVAPERGRFLIYAPVMGNTMEQILTFTDDEDELVELVLRKCRELSGAEVGLFVLPELHARFERFSGARS